jgi:hypothetical protein
MNDDYCKRPGMTVAELTGYLERCPKNVGVRMHVFPDQQGHPTATPEVRNVSVYSNGPITLHNIAQCGALDDGRFWNTELQELEGARQVLIRAGYGKIAERLLPA